MDITALIGSLGAGIVLLGFVMNQLHKWDNKNVLYLVSNFVGSVLLIIYAIILSSIPFMILNTIWALVSLRSLITKK